MAANESLQKWFLQLISYDLFRKT